MIAENSPQSSSSSKTIGVVTVGRSDYSYYLPILKKLQTAPGLKLHLIAAGMHLSPQYGSTWHEIEKDGFQIAEKVEMLVSSDTPGGIAKSIGLGIIGFSQAYDHLHPNVLLLLGDRFEMLAAAAAALPFSIPLAHIAGGELTEGAVDEVIRHAITKMSHLHFVSTQRYRQRVIQMGEEPWRVIVSGAPSLDNLKEIKLLKRNELEAQIGFCLEPPPLLITFHPETLDAENTRHHIDELLAALDAMRLPIVFTLPNADTHNHIIAERIKQYVSAHENACLVNSLGTLRYLSLMQYALAMVGNSSSGIIEAASFKLGVVNIGERQKGRCHERNVIDVPHNHDEITKAIRMAISPEFRNALQNLENPYGTGNAADVIVETLTNLPAKEKLLKKSFHDLKQLSS